MFLKYKSVWIKQVINPKSHLRPDFRPSIRQRIDDSRKPLLAIRSNRGNRRKPAYYASASELSNCLFWKIPFHICHMKKASCSNAAAGDFAVSLTNKTIYCIWRNDAFSRAAYERASAPAKRYSNWRLFHNVDKQIFEYRPQASTSADWQSHAPLNCDSAIRPDNKTIDGSPGSKSVAILRCAHEINVVAKKRRIRISPNTNSIAIRFVQRTNVELNAAATLLANRRPSFAHITCKLAPSLRATCAQWHALWFRPQ